MDGWIDRTHFKKENSVKNSQYTKDGKRVRRKRRNEKHFKGGSTQRIKERGKMDRTGQDRTGQEKNRGRQAGCVQTGTEVKEKYRQGTRKRCREME